jgi:hypothetical protein
VAGYARAARALGAALVYASHVDPGGTARVAAALIHAANVHATPGNINTAFDVTAGTATSPGNAAQVDNVNAAGGSAGTNAGRGAVAPIDHASTAAQITHACAGSQVDRACGAEVDAANIETARADAAQTRSAHGSARASAVRDSAARADAARVGGPRVSAARAAAVDAASHGRRPTGLAARVVRPRRHRVGQGRRTRRLRRRQPVTGRHARGRQRA